MRYTDEEYYPTAIDLASMPEELDYSAHFRTMRSAKPARRTSKP